MGNFNSTTNLAFHVLNRTHSKGVQIARILKSGKAGKPFFAEFYGNEKTAQEVIDRMEENNPGTKFVEA